MSLAFSAVLIFLIFVPGAILRRSYFSGRFSLKFVARSPLGEIVWAIIPGTLLHLVMIFFIQKATTQQLDFATLGYLLVGAKDDANTARAFQVLGRDLGLIAKYNLLLWAIAAIIGHGFRLMVWRYHLDLRFNLLRFNNEWYYLLSGETKKTKPGDVNYVWIDALVEKAGGGVIYSGLLVDFNLSQEGGLESIYLTQVARRFLTSESTGETKQKPRYYDIPGDIFVLKYTQVVNLNISIYDAVLEDVTEEPESR
ncbi:MAG TPA: hypothetical protein VGA99_09580 [bacterium]